MAQLDVGVAGVGLQFCDEPVVDFGGGLPKRDQAAHAQGGSDGRPAGRVRAAGQADEQVAREQWLFHHHQCAAAQLFNTDERQKALKALTLKVLHGHAFLANFRVDQIPVAHSLPMLFNLECDCT